MWFMRHGKDPNVGHNTAKGMQVRTILEPLPLDTARVGHQSRGAVIDATSYPEFCVQGTTGSGFSHRTCCLIIDAA